MNLIVAVDQNWAIGKAGRLLVNIPADRQMFMKETTGKTVVMGRKTLESLPGGQPLGKRENIVLTRDENYRVKGAAVCHSVEEALSLLEGKDPEDIFIIGGQSIYEQLLPYCDVVHVTRIDQAYEADTYFPDLDQKPEWKITAESDEQTYFDLEYTFVRYERKKS